MGFHGCGNLFIHHISSFIEFILRIDLCHEDDMMKICATSLKGDAKVWFESLDTEEIPSFAGFIEAFCVRWSPSDHEKWMIIFLNFKMINDEQNLIHEAPSPPMLVDHAITKEYNQDFNVNQLLASNSSMVTSPIMEHDYALGNLDLHS
jgi:hypothetical protein